jgi:uncharacterized OB-fold protein
MSGFPLPDTNFPLPNTDWEPTRRFWQAAAEGRLEVPRCAACSRYVWYPKEHCPGCGGADLAWTPVSGRGTLFSFAVVRRAFLKELREKEPYATGLVALDEDPAVRIATLLVDCAPEELRVDMPVRAVFRALRFSHTPREVMAPMFVPARDGA